MSKPSTPFRLPGETWFFRFIGISVLLHLLLVIPAMLFGKVEPPPIEEDKISVGIKLMAPPVNPNAVENNSNPTITEIAEPVETPPDPPAPVEPPPVVEKKPPKKEPPPEPKQVVEKPKPKPPQKPTAKLEKLTAPKVAPQLTTPKLPTTPKLADNLPSITAKKPTVPKLEVPKVVVPDPTKPKAPAAPKPLVKKPVSLPQNVAPALPKAPKLEAQAPALPDLSESLYKSPTPTLPSVSPKVPELNVDLSQLRENITPTDFDPLDSPVVPVPKISAPAPKLPAIINPDALDSPIADISPLAVQRLGREMDVYNAKLIALIRSNLRSVQQFDKKLFVRIKLTIDLNGKLENASWVEKSGNSFFDDAAMRSVRSVNFPKLPENLAANPPYIAVAKIAP